MCVAPPFQERLLWLILPLFAVAKADPGVNAALAFLLAEDIFALCVYFLASIFFIFFIVISTSMVTPEVCLSRWAILPMRNLPCLSLASNLDIFSATVLCAARTFCDFFPRCLLLLGTAKALDLIKFRQLGRRPVCFKGKLSDTSRCMNTRHTKLP